MAQTLKTTSHLLQTLAQMQFGTVSTPTKDQRKTAWAGAEQVHDPYVQRETDDPFSSDRRDNDGGYVPTMNR